MSTDAALVRAWVLALEDFSESVMKEIEALLPTLTDAGYVKINTEDNWAFTPEGVDRAVLLTLKK